MAYRDPEVDPVAHDSGAASLPTPPNWRRLYEQARERAEAAEARAEELKWAEVTARSAAGAWKSQFETARRKRLAAVEDANKARRAAKNALAVAAEVRRLNNLLAAAGVASDRYSVMGLRREIARLRSEVPCAQVQARKIRKLYKALYKEQYDNAALRRILDDAMRDYHVTRRLGDQAERVRSLRDETRDLRHALKRSEAVKMKASAVARSAALRRLEARLGPWESPGAEEEGPAEEQMPRWADYVAERADHEALFRKRSWEGLLRALYLQRSLLAAHHAAEKAALEDKRRRERATLLRCHPPWPDYPTWVRDPALARLWRERTHAPPSLEPEAATLATPATGRAHDIRDYEARAVGHWVLYATRAQHARGEVAFVDRGERITLHARDDAEAASRAAMQLAAAKWGRFRVRGSEAHKSRCARLAAEHGFALANPELQDLIGEHRRELERQAAARREEARYGAEAARLAGAIRRIGKAHGTARLVFDPPLTAGDRSAARRITAVDAAGARHDLGRHDLDTVALARAWVRGQPPRPSLASRLEARKTRHARAATADAAGSQDAHPAVSRQRPGRGIGD